MGLPRKRDDKKTEDKKTQRRPSKQLAGELGQEDREYAFAVALNSLSNQACDSESEEAANEK